MRGFGTAIMHGTTLAVLAAIAHEFAERETRNRPPNIDFSLLWFVPGYGVAVALHTAFNQFPDRPLIAMMGAILVAPVVLIGDSQLRHRRSAALARYRNMPKHRAQVDALRGGRWPDGPAGQRIAALAARLNPEAVKRVRRWWELQAWLIAEAEETMIEEAEGDAIFDARKCAQPSPRWMA